MKLFGDKVSYITDVQELPESDQFRNGRSEQLRCSPENPRKDKIDYEDVSPNLGWIPK